MGGDLRDPDQDREQGKVSFKVGVHLRVVEHGLGIFPVGHLLLRKGGAEDILFLRVCFHSPAGTVPVLLRVEVEHISS